MSYDPQKHHRRSIRLKGYDYASPGAYFVTLCVQDRVCALGNIVHRAMVFSDFGRIVVQSWLWLREQYPYVDLDVWAVMPNHLHGIIVILDNDVIRASCDASRQPTPIKRKPLGQLIGAFKTVSTKRINGMRHTPGAKFWQRNYYEHIVRDENDSARIRRYIINNPSKWQTDRDNLDNVRKLPPPSQVEDYLAEMAQFIIERQAQSTTLPT